MAVEVSNGFKNMCKSNTPSGAIGRIKIIEDDITISERTDIQDIEIEDNCYVNDKFIGTTVAKKVKVNLFNDNNIYDLENKEIDAKLGFELNGSEELISYGNFIIEKPDTEEVQAKTNFVGYDYMIKFNKDFVDNNTYPIALGTYFSNLCTQVGVIAGNTTFINSNYMVQGNPFTNGEKCKEVLSAIAQIAGGIAKIGRDNKVYIISLSKGQAVESIDGNNYDTFEPNKVFGPINKLIIKMNDGVDGEESVRSDSQSITQNGECAITISNNPILNSAEQRELVIDNIFNSIKGITYLPFKTNYYGYPYADSTDKINVLNVNDETKGSYIFNHTIKYDGAFSGNIETPALTKTQSMYKSTRDLRDWKRNTELKVDKINGEITAVVDTTEQIEREFETLQDIDGFAEGKYIYLDDASNELITSAKFNGETSQEGTPSPSSPSEIKNLEGNLEVKVINEDETEEQTVYFPLAEGQKLYEGSYLADDGIHNARKQVVFDGSESWQMHGSIVSWFYFDGLTDGYTNNNENNFAKCSHFIQEKYSNVANIENGKFAIGTIGNQKRLVLKNSDFTTLIDFKTWLSTHNVTLEYELEEEEIIPYNTEQQAAWNSIKSLHTYKTVTHIYSDAYAEIGYIKDNMLSAFETKASARLTQQDVQQLKIENGKISTEVSSTQSQLNNYYTKNEADNNTNSTKAELENIIQQNKTQIEQTTQALNLRVSSIETNGVDKIETSMGYTFYNTGLNIDKEGAATASTIDNEAFKVKNKSANENVFFAGYVSDQDSAYRGQTIVESTNLVVKNYLNIEGASRFQPYVNPTLGGHGTGAFDIG